MSHSTLIERAREQISSRGGILVIIGIYLASTIIISPLTDVPSHDDWSFAIAVRNLLNLGTLKFSGWTEPTLIFQTLWGGLFSLIFGYSFITLKVSTILLSLTGSIFLYLILKRAGCGDFLSVTGTAIQFLSPSFLGLSYTFMTDVPYVSLMVISLYWYLRGVEDGDCKALFIGSITATCAFLVRQLGILIPFGVFVYYLLSRRGREGGSLTSLSLASFLVPLLTLSLYSIWYAGGGSTWAQRRLAMEGTLTQLASPIKLLGGASVTAFHIMALTAFLLAALLVVILFRYRERLLGTPRRGAIFILWAFIAGGTGLYLYNSSGALMPYLSGGSFVYFRGIFPSTTWIACTIIAVAALIILLHTVTVQALELFSRGRVLSPFVVILTTLTLGELLLAAIHVNTFTKYILPTFPMVLIFCLVTLRGHSGEEARGEEASEEEAGEGRPVDGSIEGNGTLRWPYKASILVFMLAVALHSFGNTKLYFAASGAEWKAGEYLVDRGIGVEEMDISFVWDGYHMYDRRLEELMAVAPEGKINMMAPFTLQTRGASFTINQDLARNSGGRPVHQIPFEVPSLFRLSYRLYAGGEYPESAGVTIFRLK